MKEGCIKRERNHELIRTGKRDEETKGSSYSKEFNKRLSCGAREGRMGTWSQSGDVATLRRAHLETRRRKDCSFLVWACMHEHVAFLTHTAPSTAIEVVTQPGG